MRIVFLCLGMPFNGDTIKEKSLGGSESAAYYQCRELAKRGHEVCIFTNTQQEGEFDGVKYLNAGEVTQQYPLGARFEYYARNTDHDVLIIQRAAHAFHGQFASKINILQLHDLALFRYSALVNHGMWNTDLVTCVSAWHKKQVCEVYGLNPDFVKIVRNGVDPELYQNNFVRDEDGSFRLLYQSRPERGLENLVRDGGIMHQLETSDPHVHLYVCTYDNTMAQMQPFYAKLDQDIARRKNVTKLGPLTKSQLAQRQQDTHLMVYPTTFEEVSCISVMEAMHAGLPVLTTPVGALPETLADSGVFFVPLKEDQVDIGAFADKIHNLSIPGTLTRARELQLNMAKYRDWSGAVDRLEYEIAECFKRRAGTPAARARHAIEHSDIGVAFLTVEGEARKELSLYDFSKSPEAYKAHYAKHQGQYYNEFESRVIGEDVTHSSRFQGVLMYMQREQARDGKTPKRVLDYGCAHGHYLVPLAKTFKDWRFTGVDVSERAIGACAKSLQRDHVSADLICSDQSIFESLDRLCPFRPGSKVVGFLLDNGREVAIEDWHGEEPPEDTQEIIYESERDFFDVIFAGEVLEHVPNPYELLESFRSVLRPGGVIIITTPTGRWEWSGTESFRTAREHLWHFDREDIKEICGENEYDISSAPAGQDKTGRPLGSFVWAVRPHAGFGEVDYQRKLKTMAPRQTLSACLIVKDGAKTLRKCIESFVDWVDEIVVAIDPQTKDTTRLILEQLQAEFPFKPFNVFDGLSALKDGFDAARNASVDAATGDWVLWVDADEEIQTPWNFWKYLRHSQHNGFAFPQVHYSCNPPSVLTTDFPCRLFRRNAGIKFYGVVHEHPETEPGKSVPNAIIRHDVQFLHSGYVDEEVRRQRFVRNLPLLYRDLEKYPNRGLNRFLFLRDIAQQMMFESEQAQGYVLEGHQARALQGVKLWEEMLEKDPLRMIIDSLKYYSHCVSVLGEGFEATFDYKTNVERCPPLNSASQVSGRFFNKEHLQRLLAKVFEESTKHYDSKYF